MKWSVLSRLIVGAVILAWPMAGYAQEAVVSGTVTDTTGGVLPGVTVTAVHEATGNTFETVTDGTGAYRLAVRVGGYRISAALGGFSTVTRTGLGLLVGQQAVVNLQLSPATLQESVTVTGESPLIDATSSTLSGNIDPRQLSELPVSGRNWQDLAILAPGNRANAVSEAPISRDQGAYQLNVDGQQITQRTGGSAFGNPRYSRDAIAEFEFISNRFDASQGRSTGVQVNAITKSGTNTRAGTFSGYFRNDSFNAPDFIVGRVLPYSNQQLSGTAGGPIRVDRMHFFANYEYEREPQTFTYNSPYPSFNFDQTGTRVEHKIGLRLDYQFSPQSRMFVRGNTFRHNSPYDPRYTGGATRHPSAAQSFKRNTNQLFATFTQGLGNRAVNEVRAGYAGFYVLQRSVVNWPNHPVAGAMGAPQIVFPGYQIGQTHTQTPLDLGQESYSIRNDFSYSYTAKGRHELKVGAEYFRQNHWLSVCRFCMGSIDAQGGPVPSNIEELFPVWNDVSTWNLAALSPQVRRYSQGVGDFEALVPWHIYGFFVQNDWTINPRLTVNLGLRYDLTTGSFAEGVELLPFLEAGRPSDTNNFGPRVGVAYQLSEGTVLRSGLGTYYGELYDNPAHGTISWTKLAIPEVLNDGRPDFAANPFNGPAPTFKEVIASGIRRNISSNMVHPDGMEIPYSYQTSVGVQQQIGALMAVEVDYVYTGGRAETFSRNINLSYNPATGVNYPFSDLSRRPYPDWGVVVPWHTGGRSNYHGLQTEFRKRFSRGWQASANYLLSALRDAEAPPTHQPGGAPLGFQVAPDLGEDYTLAATDQRHRVVFNGIWEMPYGFQLSGLYLFGSGERFATNYGGDRRQTGTSGGLLRPDNTIVPRNNLVGEPIHKVDMRVQRRFALAGRTSIDGIFEVFNLLNHENYGSYVTAESNRKYGQPTQNVNVAYQPRTLQLGFRFTF